MKIRTKTRNYHQKQESGIEGVRDSDELKIERIENTRNWEKEVIKWSETIVSKRNFVFSFYTFILLSVAIFIVSIIGIRNDGQTIAISIYFVIDEKNKTNVECPNKRITNEKRRK